MSAIDRITFTVTAYNCKICGKWHKKGSKKFEEHFDANCGGKGMVRPLEDAKEEGKNVPR